LTITITLGKKKPPPGVDLGSGWIKVVTLGVSRKRPFLEKLGRSSLLGFDGDKAEKASSRASDRLNELWQRLGIREKSVISAMTGHAVIIKHMTVPAEAAADIRSFLTKEAKQYIPFDLQDVYLDHQILGPGPRESALDLILVVSKKKEVEERLSILMKAGLEPRVMDVDAFALSNCFEFNYPEFQAEPQYLLDVGGDLSLFCVAWHGRLVFQRELSLGGEQVTDRLAKILNKSRLEGEKIKINGPGDFSPERLSRELEAVVSSWSAEIHRLIGFYTKSVPGCAPAKNLFLSGGGSLLSGLRERLARGLELNVQHLNPWRMLEPDLNQFDPAYLRSVGPQFAVAAGLALREAMT
jgi:type IV pilus assembly protein PilM